MGVVKNGPMLPGDELYFLIGQLEERARLARVLLVRAAEAKRDGKLHDREGDRCPGCQACDQLLALHRSSMEIDALFNRLRDATGKMPPLPMPTLEG